MVKLKRLVQRDAKVCGLVSPSEWSVMHEDLASGRVSARSEKYGDCFMSVKF